MSGGVMRRMASPVLDIFAVGMVAFLGAMTGGMVIALIMFLLNPSWWPVATVILVAAVVWGLVTVAFEAIFRGGWRLLRLPNVSSWLDRKLAAVQGDRPARPRLAQVAFGGGMCLTLIVLPIVGWVRTTWGM